MKRRKPPISSPLQLTLDLTTSDHSPPFEGGAAPVGESTVVGRNSASTSSTRGVPLIPADCSADRDGGLVRAAVSAADAAASLADSLRRTFEEDLAAAELWILARCGDLEGAECGHAESEEPACGLNSAGEGARRRDHTALAYRREALRFLMWLHRVQTSDLQGARLEDALQYRAFLANPQPRASWCGPRGAPAGSPEWRPFVGPLSPRSRRQALVVLKSMFRFLQDQGYLTRNPFSGIAMPRNSSPRIDPGRSLTARQLGMVLRSLEDGCVSPARMQMRWALRFLHATGLRLSEFVGARVEDLRFVEIESAAPDAHQMVAVVPAGRDHETLSGATSGNALGTSEGRSEGGVPGGWAVTVTGKGAKPRDVPVAVTLVDELRRLVRLRGGGHCGSSGTPLVVSWRRDESGNWQGIGPLSAQAFHRQLKRVLRQAADLSRTLGRNADADAIERCSSHWLRHGHGRAAVAAGIGLDVVAHGLGHASLSTTTVYTRPELHRRIVLTARMDLPP